MKQLIPKTASILNKFETYVNALKLLYYSEQNFVYILKVMASVLNIHRHLNVEGLKIERAMCEKVLFENIVGILALLKKYVEEPALSHLLETQLIV